MTASMVVFTIVVGVFGIIGGICGIWSLFYGRRQTKLAEQDIRDRRKQDAEDDNWAERFEKVSNQLRRINPRLQVQEPDTKGLIWVYPTVFPDPKFRVDIENYIVQVNESQTLFLPRKPQAYELRSPRMRETIEKTEALLKKFCQEHPRAAHHLGEAN
jgi:hypothetical protein